MVLDAVTWPDVAIALIAALPGLIAAVGAVLIHQQIQTPSGTPIGRQVESTHHVALSNNYALQAQEARQGREIPKPHVDPPDMKP